MSEDLLRTTLQAAVPLWMHSVRTWSFERRGHEAAKCADVIAAHGDDLMFGGKHTSETFNKLALGIACAAYQPGGITFMGDHWEAGEDSEPWDA
jgi:hypothetical protein